MLAGHDEGEPFSLTAGVSVWPGELIRLFVVVLCLALLAKGSRDLIKNGDLITDEFLFQDESGFQRFSLRSVLDQPQAGLSSGRDDDRDDGRSSLVVVSRG